MIEHFLWVEKYRPHKIADCILPGALKNTFQQFVNDQTVPNLLLTGGPGVGKTTVAMAMLDELGADYIKINGSLRGGIDTLRNDIESYASTVSFSGGRKYVILDEADYLNANSTQPALRGFIEDYSKTCGFILTCNFKNRIIGPLHSRVSVVEFKIGPKEKAKLASDFMKRVCKILELEKVEFDKKVVSEVILKHFPDWRRVLNELQRYSRQQGGNIDTGILAQVVDLDMKELLPALKAKDFKTMRKWVAQNSNVDQAVLYRNLYENAYEIIKPESIPMLVIYLADYQYKAAFVVDAEINLAAALTQIMADCEFL